MVDVIEIDRIEVDALKDRQEGHFFDFKSKRINAGKLTRTISAFANSDGGEAYIGIEDPKNGWNWDGFEEIEMGNGII